VSEWFLIILCATSCIMFPLSICVRLFTLSDTLLVVRKDLCFIVISLCHVVGSYCFASAFLL